MSHNRHVVESGFEPRPAGSGIAALNLSSNYTYIQTGMWWGVCISLKEGFMLGGLSSRGNLVFTTYLAGREARDERLHSLGGQMETLRHGQRQQVVCC